MKNQKDGHHKKTDSNKPLHHTEGTDTDSQFDSPTQEYIRQEKHAESQQAFEDRIKMSDRWMIRLTAALVFVSIVSAAIYYSQLRAMKTQADIMQGQLTAAQDSIKIAKDTLEDARKSGKEQSDRAERLTKANEKIAQASKQSVENSKASLEASSKQSQVALDASREVTNLDQRAWVGLVGVETLGGEQTSDAFSFKAITVTIRNSGKTPALKMSGECCMYVTRPWTDHTIPDYDTETKRIEEERSKHNEERRKRNEEEIKRHPEFADRIREFEQSYSQASENKISTGGVLAPGIINNISVAPSMKFGTARKPGEAPQTLYVLGRFTYNDIFTGTQRRSTKFCLMHTMGNSFTICPESNWMD